MTAPMTIATKQEEKACDAIALFWVRSGRGIGEWKESFPEILAVMREELPRAGRIKLCDVVDTWEEDFCLNADDLDRFNGEICGWIVSYQAGCGFRAR